MRRFHTDESPHRTVCFICEHDGSGFYADTERDFYPQGVTPIDGRKRVCHRCVKEMALQFPDEVVSSEEVAKKDERIAELNDALAQATTYDAFIEATKILANKLDTVKPVAKPAARKAAPKKVTPSGGTD